MVYSQNQINNTAIERTISVTTGSIGPGGTEDGTIQIGRNFVIKKVDVNFDSEVRLYGDSAARTADSGRSFGDPIPEGSHHRKILELKLDVDTGHSWHCSPSAVGANTDSPTTGTIYYTIFNNEVTTKAITVTIKAIVFEV